MHENELHFDITYKSTQKVCSNSGENPIPLFD